MSNPKAGQHSGAWKPGQSGNPGGRPKIAAEVKSLARDYSLRAIQRLAELMDSSDERVAKAACDSLLDRAIGLPTREIKKTVTHIKKSPRDYTLDELRAMLEAPQEPPPAH